MSVGRRDFIRRAAAFAFASGCARPARPVSFGAASAFLDERLVRGAGDELLVVTDPSRGRRAAYDAALVALVLLRRARRDDAARVLLGVARTQRADGAVPFSITPGAEEECARYVRSGAAAWCGYAAAELLDAGAWSGGDRDRVVAFGHRIAAYLLARQVDRDDPRQGLILGGEGTHVADVDDGGAITSRFVPGVATWCSSEHNIDAYFFLRRFGTIVERAEYIAAADRVRAALFRSFDEAAGQLAAGVSETGLDRTWALDAASWGAVFLLAVGEVGRGARSARVADERFASLDPVRGVAGHRPFASGPIFANERVAARFHPRTWDALPAVWPEGSAGVALAAHRSGESARARAIIDALESLRDRGALPGFTRDVPLNFDVEPSVAGSAWVELVRYELARPPGAPTLWA